MRILAADTSCDDSCVSIVDTTAWKLLSEVMISHTEPMRKFGGIVPEIASREHLKALPLATEEALTKAGLTLADIDGYAVTHRPGLIGALLIGVSYIKALAFTQEKPFYVLNHIEGHLYSPLLATFEGKEAPPFPWLALVVSGGHTELFHVAEVDQYQHLGGTLDDAAGEAFDKTGKLLGYPYPAGPLVDKLVRENPGVTLPKNPFPISEIEGWGFSFSGLKTAVHLHLQKYPPADEAGKIAVAHAVQEAILDQLVNKLTEAQKAFPTATIVVSGGVACNSRLRAKLPSAYFPAPRHCTDNASMMGLLCALKAKKGSLAPASFDATAIASGDF